MNLDLIRFLISSSFRSTPKGFNYSLAILYDSTIVDTLSRPNLPDVLPG